MPRTSRSPRLVVDNQSGAAVAPPPRFKPPIDIVSEASPLRWLSTSSIPQRQWLYGHDLVRKFVTVTVAAGGTGKTLLTVAEALAMATGRNLLGAQPSGQLRVWLYNLEDPVDEMERRVLAAASYYGIAQEEVGGRIFLDSGRSRPLVVVKDLREGLTAQVPVLDGLVQAIRSRRIDVLIVDPFVSSHEVRENDNAGIDRVAKLWGKVADRTGCAVHLVHHARKTYGAEAGIDDARGASALIAAARVGRVLNPMTRDEAAKVGLPSPRSHFRISNGKSSLAKPAEADTWFEIRSVDLGNGPEGAPGDAVGVVTPWAWTTTIGSVDAGQVLAIHQALAEGQWRESFQAAEWVGLPIAAALGLDPERDRKKVRSIIETMLSEGHLARVEGLDAKRMKRTFIAPATPQKIVVGQGVASEAT